jgi:membrane fusion protein (multidrug efflux system)
MKPTKGLWLVLAIIVIISMIVEWRPWQHKEAEVAVESAVINNTNEEKINSLPKIPETIVEEHQPIRAQLSAINFTTIAAELSEKILKLPFRDGQKFKKGDVLVMFDCGVQEAQLNKSKAELSIAERNATTKEKLLKLGAVGRVEYENSLSEFQKVKAQVSEIEVILSRCVTRAPYHGHVVEQRVHPQQFVSAGQPLLEIIDNSALELEFIVPSKWSSWLSENNQFNIHMDETNKDYPAKVTQVGARIDPISQTIKVRAAIQGDFLDLRPGMSGTVNIEVPHIESHL